MNLDKLSSWAEDVKSQEVEEETCKFQKFSKWWYDYRIKNGIVVSVSKARLAKDAFFAGMEE